MPKSYSLEQPPKNKSLEIDKNSENKIEPEVFDPVLELQQLKQKLHQLSPASDKEERHQLLEDYKQKLIEQRKGLAEMQEALIKIIRENPDKSFSELVEEAEGMREKFGFSKEQMEITKSVLKEYDVRRQSIKSVREKYPNDEELFEFLFGRKPKGKIKVVVGPAVLSFRCFDERDVAYVDHGVYLEKREPTEQEINSAAGGFRLDSAPGHLPEGCIIFENYVVLDKVYGNKQRNAQALFVHEEQHAINNLFREISHRMFWWKKLLAAETSSEAETCLIQYFRSTKEDAEAKAKDELLATIKGMATRKKVRNLNAEVLFSLFIYHGNWPGSYNYLDRQWVSRFIQEILGVAEEGTVTPELKLWLKELAQKFFIHDYRKTLKEAIEACKKIYESDLPLEQVIALLQQEPLSRWPKIAERLVEKHQ